MEKAEEDERKLNADSKEAVALQLMQFIHSQEKPLIEGMEKGQEIDLAARKYWLTLYSECYKATSGRFNPEGSSGQTSARVW